MKSLSEMIAKEQEEWAQLTGNNSVRMILENSDSFNPVIRRNIIIGDMVCEYFPKFLKLEPQDSEQKNQVEFEPLRMFLSKITIKKKRTKKRYHRIPSTKNQKIQKSL